jgi:hypothetical protein
VLQREGTSRRYFYRFSDPILQPYVILKGMATELITEEQRRRFQGRPWEKETVTTEFGVLG